MATRGTFGRGLRGGKYFSCVCCLFRPGSQALPGSGGPRHPSGDGCSGPGLAPFNIHHVMDVRAQAPPPLAIGGPELAGIAWLRWGSLPCRPGAGVYRPGLAPPPRRRWGFRVWSPCGMPLWHAPDAPWPWVVSGWHCHSPPASCACRQGAGVYRHGLAPPPPRAPGVLVRSP